MSIDSRVMAFFDAQDLWLQRHATRLISPPSHHENLLQLPGISASWLGTSGVIMIHDPEIDAQSVSAAINWFRRDNAVDVLIWAPEPHNALEVQLTGLGARESFQPWWMWQERDITTPFQSSWSVRKATPDDIKPLMHTDIPYAHDGQLGPIRDLIADIDHPEVVMFVAQHHNKLIGTAMANISTDCVGVFNVGVSPVYQKRGVGAAMMHTLHNALIERGHTKFALNATPQGELLYSSLGYTMIGRGQTWLLPATKLHISS